MHVYWLEQTQADVPDNEDWLSEYELAILLGMRFPKRRDDWLLGRWTAKNAFALCFGYSTQPQSLRETEIRAMPSGAPVVYFRKAPATGMISLSHRAGIGACALTTCNSLLGCDLEMVELHSEAFVEDYFTDEEQALVARAAMVDRPQVLALLWSGKESALKAVRKGLRLDTRSVAVDFDTTEESVFAGERSLGPYDSLSAPSSISHHGWTLLKTRHRDGQVLHGWWSQSGSLVRTVLGAPQPAPPILLARAPRLA